MLSIHFTNWRILCYCTEKCSNRWIARNRPQRSHDHTPPTVLLRWPLEEYEYYLRAAIYRPGLCTGLFVECHWSDSDDNLQHAWRSLLQRIRNKQSLTHRGSVTVDAFQHLLRTVTNWPDALLFPTNELSTAALSDFLSSCFLLPCLSIELVVTLFLWSFLLSFKCKALYLYRVRLASFLFSYCNKKTVVKISFQFFFITKGTHLKLWFTSF
jgi:hypothetical protein